MSTPQFSSTAQEWLSNGKSNTPTVKPTVKNNNTQFSPTAQEWLTAAPKVKTQPTQATTNPVAQKLPTVQQPVKLVAGQKQLTPQQMKQITDTGGHTLDAPPQQSLWDQFTSFFRNTFTPDSDKNRVTAAQGAYAISKTPKGKEAMKQNNVSLPQLADTGGSLFRNSPQEELQKQLGIRSTPTNSEYTQMLMTGAIALGLVEAPAATVKGLVSFEAANRLKSGLISAIQGKGFDIKSDKTLSELTPEGGYTTKTTLDVLDFLATTAATGGLYKVLDSSLKGLTEPFTKSLFEKYNLPKVVKFDPEGLRTTVFKNDSKQLVDFFKETGTDAVEFTKASLENKPLEIPSEKLANVIKKPYWKELKGYIEKNAIDEVTPQVKKTDLGITPNEKLSPDHKTIETNFGNYLQDNYEEALTRYDALPESQGGKVINTDVARELSSDYVADRSKSGIVHEPASAFTKKLYEEKLKVKDPNGNNNVLFTAGGTGSGKSTAIENVPEVKALADNAQIIYDTTMTGFNPSVAKIELALKADKNVGIAYVYREPVEALINGALPRADRMGRTVTLKAHLDSHVESMKTILQLAEHYKDNPRVSIEIIDNSRGKGGAVLSKLDLLKEISYNKDELGQKLTSALDTQYEQNKITEKTYNGFNQERPEASAKAVEGTVSRDGTGNDQKPQSESNTKPSVDEKKTTEEKASNNTKGNEFTGAQNPVGTGKLRESEAYKKVRDQLEESTRQDVNYNRLNLAKDAENAMELVSKDYQKALRVAKGLEAAPEGQTETAISIALADKAGRDGNFKLQSNLESSRSLRQTRRGQEIVSERGRFNDNSPHRYIADIIDRRMRAKGNSLKNIDFADIKSIVSGAKKRTIAAIDAQTEKLQKVLKQERAKQAIITDVQSFIDGITCA